MKKVYELITRDGIRSEQKPIEEFRNSIKVACAPRATSYVSCDEGSEQFAIDAREYRFKRVRTIEVYEYEEV